MDQALPPAAEDTINFADIFRRLRAGFILTLGLTFTGIGLGIAASWIAAQKQPATTSLRVAFGFPGFERGTYPNGTKFQADDVRAPDIVNEAIRQLNLPNADGKLATAVRGAISITGFVAPGIIKERDRLRAAGQTPPPFFPDEYELSLSLPRDFPLAHRSRELLLTEIVNTYLARFRRNYVEPPQQFGDAFRSLQNADFVEYELVLTREMQSITGYLEQRQQKAPRFRSPTNNLSFQDLLTEVELFAQVRLNDVLGLIYVNGLSRNRSHALLKMEYYSRTLEDQARRLTEEESVVLNLLARSQERTQNYVLANKAQPQNTAQVQPLLDQTFIDALLSNDAYNFLVRKALDAGLAVRRVQAERARLQERRERMESFAKAEQQDQAAAIAAMQTALVGVERDYQNLMLKLRECLEDYSRQEYGDAVRISAQPTTDSLTRSLLLGALTGALAGLALGFGLSLLEVGLRRRP